MTPERLAEIDIDELEQLARAAQQGQWGVFTRTDGTTYVGTQFKNPLAFVVAEIVGDRLWAPRNVKFIAAANPATLLDLIAHIRDLEAQLTAAEEECQRIRDWLAATAAPPSPEVGE